MKCIITGCALILPLGEGWVAGDLWQTEGRDYVFNGNSVLGEVLILNIIVGYTRTITAENYWERRGVFVISPADAHLNIAAQDYISRWGGRISVRSASGHALNTSPLLT